MDITLEYSLRNITVDVVPVKEREIGIVLRHGNSRQLLGSMVDAEALLNRSVLNVRNIASGGSIGDVKDTSVAESLAVALKAVHLGTRAAKDLRLEVTIRVGNTA